MIPTTRQHAYKYLREQILKGRLSNGQRINLDDIAAALGVSRMPVREAVRQLSAEGFVTIYPRRGVTVTSLDFDDILELFEMRAVLEGLAVRHAAPFIAKGGIDRLNALADGMETAENDSLLWLRRHDEFHDYLCSKSGLSRLSTQIKNIRYSVEPYIRFFLSLYSAEMPGAEHRRLIEVIKRGDLLAAENAMREHIHSAAEAILKFLRHSESNKKPGPAGEDEEARREKSDVGLSRKSSKEIVRERVEIRIPELAPPVSHYTDAVRAGDFIFISGMAALDKDGNVLAKGDVVQQTRHALDAIGKVLGHDGGSFADIVKITVYLKDINDRPRINPVRQEYFGSARPASVLVEVSDLFLPGLLVEIDAIAYVPEHRSHNAEERPRT